MLSLVEAPGAASSVNHVRCDGISVTPKWRAATVVSREYRMEDVSIAREEAPTVCSSPPQNTIAPGLNLSSRSRGPALCNDIMNETGESVLNVLLHNTLTVLSVPSNKSVYLLLSYQVYGAFYFSCAFSMNDALWYLNFCLPIMWQFWCSQNHVHV